MKEHVQKPGVRQWAGEDLIELQAEPLRAVEGFFSEYGSCIIKGCTAMANEDGTHDISSGLLGLWGADTEGNRVYKTVPFSGVTGVVLPVYFTLSHSVVERAYADNKVKPIAYDYRAAVSTVQPESGDYLALTEAGAVRFTDAIQDAAHRFVTDVERTKLAGIEVEANRYVHPSEHPASMVEFTDGETLQKKLEDGSLARNVFSDDGSVVSASRSINVTGAVSGSIMYAPGGFFQKAANGIAPLDAPERLITAGEAAAALETTTVIPANKCITKAEFDELLASSGSYDPAAAPAGVYIVHTNGRVYPRANWKTSENSKAVGVGVKYDYHSFVIAPEERNTIAWGGVGILINGCSVAESDRVAINDLSGIANTDAIIAQLGTTEDYAARYCRDYTFKNGAQGYLPALMELRMVYANEAEVDACMAMIGGALLSDTASNNHWKWSSTQFDANKAWEIILRDGYVLTADKDHTHRDFYARPFAPFL